MRMPSIFVGHGTPMNAIEDNSYSNEWKRIGSQFKPKAILMISAHWFTNGNLLQDEKHPKKINDMYGFPDKLYKIDYPVAGDSKLTQEILNALGNKVKTDNSWGIDHGAWSVLVHMYPDADIPVVQLSVDKMKAPKHQYEIGKAISHLREFGYMIIASGNVVHNLRMIDFNMDKPYSWASEFDDYIENSINEEDYQKCIDYVNYGESARFSVPTPEHFYPLLNFLGSRRNGDKLTVFNRGYDLGSLSMTSYIFNQL